MDLSAPLVRLAMLAKTLRPIGTPRQSLHVEMNPSGMMALSAHWEPPAMLVQMGLLTGGEKHLLHVEVNPSGQTAPRASQVQAAMLAKMLLLGGLERPSQSVDVSRAGVEELFVALERPATLAVVARIARGTSSESVLATRRVMMNMMNESW